MKNNDKHKIISYIKSAVRIVASIAGCSLLLVNVMLAVMVLSAGYGIAEIIGILEEAVGTSEEK